MAIEMLLHEKSLEQEVEVEVVVVKGSLLSLQMLLVVDVAEYLGGEVHAIVLGDHLAFLHGMDEQNGSGSVFLEHLQFVHLLLEKESSLLATLVFHQLLESPLSFLQVFRTVGEDPTALLLEVLLLLLYFLLQDEVDSLDVLEETLEDFVLFFLRKNLDVLLMDLLLGQVIGQQDSLASIDVFLQLYSVFRKVFHQLLLGDGFVDRLDSLVTRLVQGLHV